jgi:hypothetical protein
MTDLRSPTYAETVSIETYKTSAGTALSDADSFGDKIVTAAASLATAYGAVIALVSPEDTAAPLLAAAPFALLALAVAAGLYAQSIGVSIDETNELKVIRTRIATAVSDKRSAGHVGLVFLIVGVALAGYIINESYGGPADESKRSAQIWLTPAGERLIEDACGSSATEVTGEVDEDAEPDARHLSVALDANACASGAGTLVLPSRAISVAKLGE